MQQIPLRNIVSGDILHHIDIDSGTNIRELRQVICEQTQGQLVILHPVPDYWCEDLATVADLLEKTETRMLDVLVQEPLGEVASFVLRCCAAFRKRAHDFEAQAARTPTLRGAFGAVGFAEEIALQQARGQHDPNEDEDRVQESEVQLLRVGHAIRGLLVALGEAEPHEVSVETIRLLAASFRPACVRFYDRVIGELRQRDESIEEYRARLFDLDKRLSVLRKHLEETLLVQMRFRGLAEISAHLDRTLCELLDLSVDELEVRCRPVERA